MNTPIANLHPTIAAMRGSLIVSCQASASDQIYGPDAMASMARAAQTGGAVGIRANGPADIAAIRAAVPLPIIGIYKRDLPGLGIRITPMLEDARLVVEAGATIVAVDATRRGAEEGRLPAAELIRQVKDTLHVLVMADIATYEEGIAAAQSGADIVATTLSGYTAYSPMMDGPDFDLLARLAAAIPGPVIAEGRIATPEHARRILELGGFAVVVGGMITRPRWITEQFVAGMRSVARARQTVIGVDIGGTKIAAAVVDPASPTVMQDLVQVPTLASEGGPRVLERVEGLISDLLAKTPAVAALGISTSGEVDRDGAISFATDFMPGYRGMAVRSRFESRFGLPTAVENDGQASTLGEALYGAGRGHRAVLGVSIGTGIGGGFVLDQRVYEGASRGALALGHIPIAAGDGSRRPCTCGRFGCLEAYASGPALLKEFALRTGRPDDSVSAEMVEAAIRAGQPEALASLGTLCDWLGIGLAAALNLLNPDIVVVSGGVAQIGDALFDLLRKRTVEHAYSTVNSAPIVPAQLGTGAGVVGAAELARRAMGR